MTDPQFTPSPSPHLAAAFAELSDLLNRNAPLDVTLLRVAQLLKESNPDAVGASVSMLETDRASTVVYTGAVAMLLDEWQYELGSGPCLDAARTGGTVVVASEPLDPRYPQFGERALDERVGLTVSTGLTRAAGTVAGLNVYAGPGQAADEPWLRLIRAFANYASLAVAQVGAAGVPDELRQLRQVVTSRALVDRATATLVSRHQYTRDAALQELLTAARVQQRPLVAVAAAILT